MLLEQGGLCLRFEPCNYLPASDPPFASGAGWDQGPESKASEQQAKRESRRMDREGKGHPGHTKKKGGINSTHISHLFNAMLGIKWDRFHHAVK